jgi:hypothetical protein
MFHKSKLYPTSYKENATNTGKKLIFKGVPDDPSSPEVFASQAALDRISLSSDYELGSMALRQIAEKQGFSVVEPSALCSKPMGETAGEGLFASKLILRGQLVGFYGGLLELKKNSPESCYKQGLGDLCYVGNYGPYKSAADLVQHALPGHVVLDNEYIPLASLRINAAIANTILIPIESPCGLKIYALQALENIRPGQPILRDHGPNFMEVIKESAGVVKTWDKKGNETSPLIFIGATLQTITGLKQCLADWTRNSEDIESRDAFLITILNLHYSILYHFPLEQLIKIRNFLGTTSPGEYLKQNAERTKLRINDIKECFDNIGQLYYEGFMKNVYSTAPAKEDTFTFKLSELIECSYDFIINHPDTAFNVLFSKLYHSLYSDLQNHTSDFSLPKINLDRVYHPPGTEKFSAEKIECLKASALSLYQLGMSHYRNGRYEDAINDWQQALKINKDVAFSANQGAHMLPIYCESYSCCMSPEVATLTWNLGNAYKAKEDYVEALYFLTIVREMLAKKPSLAPGLVEKIGARIKECCDSLVYSAQEEKENLVDSPSIKGPGMK